MYPADFPDAFGLGFSTSPGVEYESTLCRAIEGEGNFAKTSTWQLDATGPVARFDGNANVSHINSSKLQQAYKHITDTS